MDNNQNIQKTTQLYLSITEKFSVISLVEKISIQNASKITGKNRKTKREWKANKEEFLNLPNKKKTFTLH